MVLKWFICVLTVLLIASVVGMIVSKDKQEDPYPLIREVSEMMTIAIGFQLIVCFIFSSFLCFCRYCCRKNSHVQEFEGDFNL